MKGRKQGGANTRIPFDASPANLGSRSPKYKGAPYQSPQQDPRKRKLSNFHYEEGVDRLFQGVTTAKPRQERAKVQSKFAKRTLDKSLEPDAAGLQLADQWREVIAQRDEIIRELESEIQQLQIQQQSTNEEKELLQQRIEQLIRESQEANRTATAEAKLYRDQSAQAFRSAAQLLPNIGVTDEDVTAEKLLEGVGEYTKVEGNHDDTLGKIIEFLMQENQALRQENLQLRQAQQHQLMEYQLQLAKFTTQIIALSNEVKSLNEIIKERDEEIARITSERDQLMTQVDFQPIAPHNSLNHLNLFNVLEEEVLDERTEQDIDRDNEPNAEVFGRKSRSGSIVSVNSDAKEDSYFRVDAVHGNLLRLRPLEEGEDLNATGRFDFVVKKSMIGEDCKEGEEVGEEKSLSIKEMIQKTLRDVANKEDIQMTDQEIAIAVILAVKNGGFSKAKNEVKADLEKLGCKNIDARFSRMAKFSVSFQKNIQAFTGNESELAWREKEGTLDQLTHMRLKRIPFSCLEGIVNREVISNICRKAEVDLESLQNEPAPVPSVFAKDPNARSLEVPIRGRVGDF